MSARFTLSIRDYSGEMSTISLPGVDLTSANFDAQDGLWDTLQSAIDGVVVGMIANRKLLAQDLIVSADLPTSAFAQRELKWLVRYTGNTLAKKYTAEIPTPDAALLLAGTDNMNLGVGAGATFVTAFEAYAKSPDDVAETVTVIDARVVGRNI